MARILIVDGQPQLRQILASGLGPGAHEIFETSGIAQTRRCMGESNYDVVIAAQPFANDETIRWPAFVEEMDSSTSLIFVAADAAAESLSDSLRHEPVDFLNRPSASELVCAVRRACDRTRLLRENKLLKETIASLQKNENAGNGHGSLAETLVRSVPDSFDLTGLLENAEKQLILKTLTATGGAQAAAARRMGLSRSALAYKLTKYGIKAPSQ
jgi:two-component system C4-dicarboxylate transport response regulator DctD